MQIIRCEQGSKEWHNARLGKITASRVHDILPGKSGYKKAREKYMYELICEILTGNIQEAFIPTWAMEHGKAVEAVSRSAYEAKTGKLIEEVGFILSHLDYLGCSPDGIIDMKKGVEIKCPNSMTHIQILTTGEIPAAHYTQIQTGMFCSGFDSWDYVSYDNRFPANLQLYIQSIERDDEYIEYIETEVMKFHNEINFTLDCLREYTEEGGFEF